MKEQQDMSTSVSPLRKKTTMEKRGSAIMSKPQQKKITLIKNSNNLQVKNESGNTNSLNIKQQNSKKVTIDEASRLNLGSAQDTEENDQQKNGLNITLDVLAKNNDNNQDN